MKVKFSFLPILLLIALALAAVKAFAQSQTERYRVMFYNVENLFDPFDDSLKLDDEFTSRGTRYWTWNRMEDKINKTYKTITAVGEWDLPMIVGFCEIENRFVVNRLIKETPLARFGYELVHRESPDARGIDVALIYRPDLFSLLEKHWFRVEFPEGNDRKTREILYVSGIVDGIDTLHVFVNHWPSKYGGELESEPGRMAAAATLRHKVDSIRVFYPNAKMLLMGDFNDEPLSTPLVEGLGACDPASEQCPSGLVNLSIPVSQAGLGSHKFQGTWSLIDQMVVTQSLYVTSHGLRVLAPGQRIFSAPFLLEPDEAYVGSKPFRTYVGFKYNGGFSDHLPVYVDLVMGASNR
jgi:predicted extracellular nuclease